MMARTPHVMPQNNSYENIVKEDVIEQLSVDLFAMTNTMKRYPEDIQMAIYDFLVSLKDCHDMELDREALAGISEVILYCKQKAAKS